MLASVFTGKSEKMFKTIWIQLQLAYTHLCHTCKAFITHEIKCCLCFCNQFTLCHPFYLNHYISLVMFDLMSVHGLFHQSISSFLDVFSHLSILPFNSLKPKPVQGTYVQQQLLLCVFNQYQLSAALIQILIFYQLKKVKIQRRSINFLANGVCVCLYIHA